MLKNTIVYIYKKPKADEEESHGGSWKVAYADFVTAMMAFFLLLWLISMVSPEKRTLVSAYFKYFSLFEKSGTSILEGHPSYLKEFGDEVPRYKIPSDRSISESKTTKTELAKLLQQQIQQKLTGVEDQVVVDITEQGVKIEIMDREGGKPIFPLGSAKLSQEGEKILETIGKVIAEIDNKIIIEGHTDALNYSGQKYTNWELSTDRASAARQELEKHGLNPQNIAQVAGYAATKPLIPDNPNDPRNRRISIIIFAM